MLIFEITGYLNRIRTVFPPSRVSTTACRTKVRPRSPCTASVATRHSHRACSRSPSVVMVPVALMCASASPTETSRPPVASALITSSCLTTIVPRSPPEPVTASVCRPACEVVYSTSHTPGPTCVGVGDDVVPSGRVTDAVTVAGSARGPRRAPCTAALTPPPRSARGGSRFSSLAMCTSGWSRLRDHVVGKGRDGGRCRDGGRRGGPDGRTVCLRQDRHPGDDDASDDGVLRRGSDQTRHGGCRERDVDQVQPGRRDQVRGRHGDLERRVRRPRRAAEVCRLREHHAGRRAQRQVSGRRGAGGRGAGDEGDRPDQVTSLPRNRRGVHHTGGRDGDVRRRVPPRHGFLPGRVRGGPLPQVVACEDVAVLPHDPILSAAGTPPPTGARGGVSGSACSDAEGRSRETGTGDRTVGTWVATGGERRVAEDDELVHQIPGTRLLGPDQKGGTRLFPQEQLAVGDREDGVLRARDRGRDVRVHHDRQAGEDAADSGTVGLVLLLAEQEWGDARLTEHRLIGTDGRAEECPTPGVHDQVRRGSVDAGLDLLLEVPQQIESGVYAAA